MKKGFTLIELITVIIVLGIVGLIVFPVVNKSIKNSKEKAYDRQVDMIVEGARKWAVSHNNELPDMETGAYLKIQISDLMQSGDITKTKDGKLKNPKEGSKNMEGCVLVHYSNEYNQYLYEYSETCIAPN